MSKDISKKLILDFWKYMQGYYGTRVVDKKSSKLMKFVSIILNKFGAMSRKNFMDDFTTTLGKNIYTNFKVGDSDTMDLRKQISICVHEHQHVVQFNKDIGFSRKYIFNDSARAHYEADAYRCNMEIYYWYTGKLLDPARIAKILLSYGCSKGDVEVCKRNLEMSAVTIGYGGIISEASKVAIRWLNENIDKYNTPILDDILQNDISKRIYIRNKGEVIDHLVRGGRK